MKNHFTANLFIGLFLLLCLIPSLGMLVLGPSPLLANESAPRTPALLDREGVVNPDVLTDVTDYMGTRFALRPYLVSARSFLYEKLLNSSAEEQVILGTDGHTLSILGFEMINKQYIMALTGVLLILASLGIAWVDRKKRAEARANEEENA